MQADWELEGSDQFDVQLVLEILEAVCVQLKVKGQCNASVTSIHGWHEVNVTEAG